MWDPTESLRTAKLLWIENIVCILLLMMMGKRVRANWCAPGSHLLLRQAPLNRPHFCVSTQVGGAHTARTLACLWDLGGEAGSTPR